MDNSFSLPQRTRKQLTRKKYRNRLPAEQFYYIKQYFNNCCAYCGKTNVKLTQEHFVPVSKGGKTSVKNIIPVCKECNASRGHKKFFKWYPWQEFYTKEREQIIFEYPYKIKNYIKRMEK